jgi:hypothetical protein
LVAQVSKVDDQQFAPTLGCNSTVLSLNNQGRALNLEETEHAVTASLALQQFI